MNYTYTIIQTIVLAFILWKYSLFDIKLNQISTSESIDNQIRGMQILRKIF